MIDRHDVPYYDKEIVRRKEQEYINELLSKYKGAEANDELKKKIWEELMMEKHLGRISIPFKVVMRKDPLKQFPDQIEVILDTKV